MGKGMHITTQNEKILKHLEEHECITPLDAMNNYGIMRLGARIKDMESRGMKFIHQPVVVKNRYGQNCRVMSYALDKEGEQYE